MFTLFFTASSFDTTLDLLEKIGTRYGNYTRENYKRKFNLGLSVLESKPYLGIKFGKYYIHTIQNAMFIYKIDNEKRKIYVMHSFMPSREFSGLLIQKSAAVY